MKIIDTPGFGDTELNEDEIKSALKKVAESIFSFNKENNKIDAFILVIGFTGRLSSMKESLETHLTIFGSNVMKNTLILFIDKKNQITNLDLIFGELQKMKEIVSIINESSGRELSKDLLLIWNN